MLFLSYITVHTFAVFTYLHAGLAHPKIICNSNKLVTSDGCFSPCRPPVLQKAVYPLLLEGLLCFVRVQDRR